MVTLGDARQSTPTITKTLNPEWNVSFEMPVVGVPLLECICWDHDRFGKDYLGEFDIALEEIFEEGQLNQQVGGGINDSLVAMARTQWLIRTIAKMVHSQIETAPTTLKPEEEEEGQQCLGRNLAPILARRLREPSCFAARYIPQI